MSVTPADVASAVERAERFAALHRAGTPLLMANAWDAGSAKILAHLGFAALATTSSGFANSLGRHDGAVSRDEALGPRRRPCRGDAAAGERRPRERLRERPSRRRRHGRGGRRRSASPAVRSRIGTVTSGSSTTAPSPSTASPQRSPPPTPDLSASSSPPAPRTTSAASTTSTTRSPDSRRSSRPVPTSCSPLASRPPSRSVPSSTPSHVPVNVLVRPGVPPIAELAETRRRPHLRRWRVRPRRLRCPGRRRHRAPRAWHVRLLAGCGGGGAVARRLRLSRRPRGRTRHRRTLRRLRARRR